jgi:hypothetical protein
MSDKKRGFSRFDYKYIKESSTPNNLMNKNGQVTVFIIVGIIILFSTAAILFLTSSVTKESITNDGQTIITSAPQRFTAISTYTQNCIEQVTTNGLLQLGEQGGYIYPDLVGDFSATNPTESVGINLNPAKIPYWLYNEKPNVVDEVVLISSKPKLHDDKSSDSELSIESQLTRYVLENLDLCLDDYTSFSAQGYSFSQFSNKNVEVVVRDENINVVLQMPFKVSFASERTTFEQFSVKIPLNLKHYYEIAQKITDAQAENKFLEQQGIELLSVYSRKDLEYFAPISDSGYDLVSTLSWNEVELEQKYKQLLTSYVPLLRMLGTSNFFYSQTFLDSGDLLAQKVTDNMVIPLYGADDLEVSFDYFGWDPYFKTNSESGSIKPEHLYVNYGLFSFGHQRYETHYDISYPVLVTLRDPYALDGRGYNFIFALESNIRNNIPAEHGAVRESYPRGISPIGCASEQRNSEVLRSIIVDSYTQEPLESVRIGFTIPEQAECDIALTQSDGKIESSFPKAYGGVANFVKTDYLSAYYPLDTYNPTNNLFGYAVVAQNSPVIEMHKFKTLPVSVKKKNFEKCIQFSENKECYSSSGFGFGAESQVNYKPELGVGTHSWHFTGSAKDLLPTEKAFITVERVNNLRNEVVNPEYSQVAFITGNEVSEIELVPGVYKVTGTLIREENYLIPADKRCKSILLGLKKECFTIDEAQFDAYTSGQVTWDKESTYFTITPEMLYSAQDITFYLPSLNIYNVPEIEDIRIVEDMQALSMLSNESKVPFLRDALEPRFS